MLSRRQLLRLAPLGAVTGVTCWAVAGIGEPDAPRTAVAPLRDSGGNPKAAPTSGTPSASATAPAPSATATPEPPSFSARRDAATEALRSYPRRSGVSFGVAVHNARTKERFSYRGSTHFETASIVKADILSVLLVQAQDDGGSLTRSQKSLARRMIGVSDNNAASALWREAGGAGGVRRTNARLGLTDTLTTSASWGLTRTTASDQVRLLDAMAGETGPLSAASSDYVFDLMSDVVSSQDWGVSAAARKGERYAVKNGWLPRSTDSYRWIVNSIGRVTGPQTDLRIAVLSRGHSSQGAGIRLVEGIARLTRTSLAW